MNTYYIISTVCTHVHYTLTDDRDYREITVNIVNKKVKFDGPKHYSSYLATFEHTHLGLAETTLVSNVKSVSTKELFPGAAYGLTVRGIGENGESYNAVPAVVDGVRNELKLNQGTHVHYMCQIKLCMYTTCVKSKYACTLHVSNVITSMIHVSAVSHTN